MLKTFFLLLLAGGGFFEGRSQMHRYSFTEPKMGSPFTIILYCSDSTSAEKIAGKSFLLVDSLVGILSDYLDSSELNRLCARAGTGYFSCSPVLYEILWRSKMAYEESGGTFDISLGPLTRLWRSARKSGRFPDSVAVGEKKLLTGFDKIKFNRATHSVFLTKAGMQLDLGGIGQGYIAEKLSSFLQKLAVRTALIDVSGDIVSLGHPPGTSGWTVAINVPESEEELLPRQLLISDRAVTTSGDVYQFMEHNGKRYSHVIDPATGYGITTRRNVTVIAKDGTSADWLTKAFSLLPEAAAKKLAEKQHAEFLVAEMRGGRVHFLRSRKFDIYWKKVAH